MMMSILDDGWLCIHCDAENEWSRAARRRMKEVGQALVQCGQCRKRSVFAEYTDWRPRWALVEYAHKDNLNRRTLRLATFVENAADPFGEYQERVSTEVGCRSLGERWWRAFPRAKQLLSDTSDRDPVSGPDGECLSSS